MRKITRRLTALVLCACLTLAPIGAFAQTPQGAAAHVVITLQDGAQELLPVQVLVTSAGETVYWLDMSMLDEVQIEALSVGELILSNEAGELLGQYSLDGTEAGAEGEGLFELYDANNSGMSIPLMMAPMALPESTQEAELVLAEYGFESGAYDDWETVEETPEYVEEYPETVEEMPEYVEEYPEYVEETPEYVEEYPEYVEETPETVEETPEYVEEYPEYVEETPEYVEETPEYVEETPEYVEEYPEYVEETPETVEEYPEYVEETPEYEEIAEEIVQPQYVIPLQDNTNLRSAPLVQEDNVLALVGANDVLAVFGYAIDGDGRIWWQVQDVRTGVSGCIMDEVTAEATEDDYYAFLAQLEAERAEAEEPVIEEPVIEEPVIEEPVIEEPVIEEPVIEEPVIEEPVIEEPVIEEPEDAEQAEAVRYAVTSNKNNPTNNLRASADSKADVVGVYENGELVTFGEPTADGKWYPVTVVRDGAQGYMRDYLLTEISEADALARMAELPAAGDDETAEDEEEAQDEAAEETVQDGGEAEQMPEVIESGEAETLPEQQPADETGDEAGDEADAVSGTDEETGAADGLIHAFPAYAMTLPQDNAVIVLRAEAGGELPQNGAVPMIREPTPLEVTEVQTAADGQSWYLVRNMNTDETGYIEAVKVEQVTREAAEAAVKEVVSIIPPVPSDNENAGETAGGETESGEQAGAESGEPEAAPEPDTPQELTDGDIYHYGYNTGRQVGLRKAPSKSGERIYNMEAGTVLWVMSKDGDWCHVRTDRAEGYVMAEYVQLMGVNEEAAYRASIDDLETAPEVTPTPEETEEPEITPTPSPEPTEEPKAEPTATPEPQQLERYAVVARDNTQLRASADGGAYLQAMLAGGDVVYAMHSEMNAAGELWTLVQANGQWGYVLSESLRVMDEQEEADYLAALEAAKATPTPTAEPTATPEPSATPAPQRLERYARVLNDGTPLRGNPDPNAYLQTVLNKETVVYLFQSQFASDGMMWYLVQYSGQWGYIRADLVRPMGEQETADYLAALEAELATPTPMPQATPEPVSPDSTSAYAKLIKDKVNLRRTPSASGTSLDRVPVNTLLLVLGSEYDGTYTWYQVTYNNKEGYIRSDMAQMLTIAELTAYYREQMEQAQNAAKPGVSTTPNSSNNTSIVIGGSQLQDLIPVDDSWTNNVIDGMPSYATATPDPNATPTPVPPARAAALILSSGDIEVYNVPAVTESNKFIVYGETKANSAVTATVEMTVEAEATAGPATIGQSLISSAIAESVQKVKSTVGVARSDVNGHFEMEVTLPKPGEYIVEFTAADGAFARYGVTYDTGATPEPTAQPLPTAMPVEEDGGMGILPFVIGGLLIVVAAAVYGVYVYRRRSEQEEDEEDEDDEAELREEQLNMQRQRRAEPTGPRTTSTVIPGTPRAQSPTAGMNAQVPSYMKNAESRTPVSPYARPAAPTTPSAPVKPQAPAAPTAPVKPQAPATPTAPVKPQAPVAPTAPVKPQAPVAPVAPSAPVRPQAPTVTTTANEAAQADASAEAPRRRRRPPVDPNA